MSRSTRETPAERPQATGIPEDRVVLVVDDDPEILQALEIGFRRAGLPVAVADSAEAALAVIGGGSVGLIVCDLGMPGMSGLELINELRAHPESAPLPIILMTGSPSVIALVPAFEAGADDFISKPIEMAELVARSRAHLRSAATWATVLEDEIRGRSAVVEALRHAPITSHPSQAALRIIDEIGRRGSLVYASLHEITADASLRPMASYAPGSGAKPGGGAAVRWRATYLIEHLRLGAWAEILTGPEPGEPDQGFWSSGAEVAAGAPIYADDELVAALFLGARLQHGALTPALQRTGLLAAAADYATIISLRLGPALRAHLQAEADRRRFADLVADRQMRTVYQPIVRLNAGGVVGYEALSRFEDGERPDVRFAEAAAAGHGDALELAAVEVAVEGARALPPDTYLAVNVSPATLVRARRALRRVIGEADRRVVVEVTEHAPIVDYEAFRSAVDEIGAPLSVDDAGAGFASLRHIVELRPAYAKLDLTLVRDIHEDPVRQSLVAGLVHYARTAGFELIGEGIEQPDEAQMLGRLGVSFGQGFLFGLPDTWPGFR